MIHPENARVAFSEDAIQNRVREMGAQIAADYGGQELIVVGVLKGSLYLLADLTRAIPMPLQVDFMSIGMYPTATNQTGVVRITKDLDLDITGKHVLVVEDIIRTGLTLGYLVQNLQMRCPESVKVCALLVNPNQQLINMPVAYQGFTVSDTWLIGYGMDVSERWRNLPYIVGVDKKPRTP
jgi:hypoxanthine phosphoribosyltransferase